MSIRVLGKTKTKRQHYTPAHDQAVKREVKRVIDYWIEEARRARDLKRGPWLYGWRRNYTVGGFNGYIAHIPGQ